MTRTNSEDRETCWKVRDFYLNCLSTSFSVDQLYESLKAGGKETTEEEIIPKSLRSDECNKLKEEMYEACPQSWVN
jgi:hypothetical protein